MNRSEILGTAKSHITKDRAATHGDAESNFALIGALWSADLGVTIGAADVARMMVLFKAARAKANPAHADNWIDLAGYAACGGEIATQATTATPNESLTFNDHLARRDAEREPFAPTVQP